MGKKIISFSVFGAKPLYYLGAELNIKEAKKHYPDWVCRIYCSSDVPNIDKLSSLDCEVVILHSAIPPIYWRLFACDDPEVDVCIVRDADSVVNAREAAAVKEWMESDKIFQFLIEQPKRGIFIK